MSYYSGCHCVLIDIILISSSSSSLLPVFTFSPHRSSFIARRHIIHCSNGYGIQPTETQPNSDDFLSPYSYNNLPNRSSSSNNNNTNSISISSSCETTTADCWVLVFGYHTEAQRQELLQHYGLVEHGNAATSRVREVRLCGPNAMALRYESPWQVVKALCRTSVTLRDGTVCAVQALSHRDPRLVQSKTTMDRPLVPMIGGSTTTIPGTDSVSSGSLVVVDEDAR